VHVEGPSLAAAQAALHADLAAEPADWQLRLQQRGGSSADLEQLLAIVRSAESHGYQLIERLGVCSASLRRVVLEHLRTPSPHARAAAGPPRRTPRSGPPGEPMRSNRAWLGRRERASRTSERPSEPREPGPRPREDAAEPTADTPARARDERPAAEAPHATVPATESPRRKDPATADARPDPAARTPTPDAEPLAAQGTTLRPVDPRSLPPLHGREGVLAQLADALLRRAPRPPVLVGPPGSGRSLVARHLARVLDAPVFVLDATEYDDEAMLGIHLEAVARRGGVAVLDDLDRVPSDAVPPFFAALARAWSRRHPPVLTIASPESHARLDLWLPGGAGAFDKLPLPPLPRGELPDAVAAAAPLVLRDHGVTLGADAKLGELTRLAARYLGGLAMPGRALDLLDLACARVARSGGTEVSRAVWLDVVSERSGLPRARIEAQGDQALLELEQRVSSQVVGHAHVIATLARLVRRNRAGFGSQRPVLSTLLLGPSGVGKTEIAKALGQALYDRPDALVRLDMSEYSESHAVARVVGAPPGYVGHEHGGALTDPLRERPHCVVLLDEIEKAHREVHQLLLQVLDEGRLTDGRGRTVELHHAVVVMTSNLGAELVDPEDPTRLDEPAVLAAARRAFPVELWNRIEAPLVMQPLTPDEMLEVCRRLARDSAERLFRERGIRYALTDDACAHLVRLAGRDPALGARPLRHLLTREVESVMAEAVLRGRLRAGTQVEVGVVHGRIALR
jgi:ATP-dependent Clp protease ATP-binding subunit ClpC